MHNVKSKYKNPDEYIRKLKAKIKLQRTWLDKDREMRAKLHGDQIVSWTRNSNVYHQNLSNGCDLGNFHVNDKVMIIGRVVKAMESTCNTGNRESSIDYKLLETRRIKE